MYGDTLENNQDLKKAFEIVSEHLTDINAHSLQLLLEWQFGGKEYTPQSDEVMFRSYEVLKNFLEAYSIGLGATK